MSVFGIDFGNLNSTVAVTRHGGVDIVTNEVSRRETTTIVSFLENERFIGEQGLDRYVRNAQNTVFLLKRFIGLRMDDPHLDAERRFLTCEIKGDETGRLMFGVNYCGDMTYFYPEQVLAMLLQRLRTYVNIATTTDPRAPADARECVLTVPCYYTAEQRRLMLQACDISGLHCLSLINDTTAAGTDYGIFRGSSLSETEDEGQIVGILDIGYGTTVFAVAKFWRGHQKLLSRTFDRHLGTRDVDYELFKHMSVEVKGKYGVDVAGNRRARLRLLQACERLKYLLSGNQVAPLNVENLMDVDVNIPSFQRTTMEELSAPLLERFKSLLRRGFDDAGVPPEKFHSVEMIGGGCRIPMFKRATEEIIKKAPSFTLNASETAARGAAITAATFSPKFKVREFIVSDLSAYPIKLGYYQENVQSTSAVPFLPEINKVVTVLGAKDHYPKTLDITIKRSGGFKLYAFYDNENPIVQDNMPPESYLIGEWEIGNAGKGVNASEVRVRVRLQPSGIISVDSAVACETFEVEEPAEKEKDKEKEKDNKEKEKDNKEKEKENENENEEPPVMVKKTKTRRTELTVTPRLDCFGLPSSAVIEFRRREHEMNERDALITRTRDSKNELESYILDNRPRIAAGGCLAPYVTAEKQTKFIKLGEEYENWLYDEGADAELAAYESRVKKLREIGDAAHAHRTNDEEVNFQITAFRENVNKLRESALQAIGKAAHITEEELRAAAGKCDETIAWAETTLKKYKSAPKTEEPCMTPKEMNEKQRSVAETVTALLNRPAPKKTENTEKKGTNENENEEEAKKKTKESKEEQNGLENEEASAQKTAPPAAAKGGDELD